ncbi:MAG: glycosyltransferase family 4 protein [Dehalococcoidia bacterium]
MKVAFLNARLRVGVGPKSVLIMLRALARVGLLPPCEAWNFYDPAADLPEPQLPETVRGFACEDGLRSEAFREHIEEMGQPGIIWVDGRYAQPHVQQVLDLCPDSFRIVYGNELPDEVEQVDRYDLCLVDEEEHVAKVRSVAPNIHVAVWDKVVDYEETFRPLPREKRYDICYVARISSRKKHRRLLRAMAKLKDRQLTCVCVGGTTMGGIDHPGHVALLAELRHLADELGISVEFVGRVSQEQVNEYLNMSRIGVICSEKDGAPRALLEYLAADLAVLVSSQLCGGRRFVTPETGLIRSRKEFHAGIVQLLDTRDRFHPRAHLVRHYSFDQVMDRMAGILRAAGCPMG